MVLLHSSKTPFKQVLSSFQLKSVSNDLIHSDRLLAKNGLVVVFTCNHCPYAKALWSRLIRDYKTIKKYGFNIVAINPNINPNYPEDSFENMVSLSKKHMIPFQYLADMDQSVAKQYDAQCTPDFYVINSRYELLYRGSYDDNWKDSKSVSNTYLIDSLNDIYKNKFDNEKKQKPSMGCSIKWLKN